MCAQKMYPKLVRVSSGTRKAQEFVYLRLMERIKVDGVWKEKVVANLGRQDIEGRKALAELLKKLRRFSDELLVTPEEIESRQARDYGSVLVGQTLWREVGLDGMIAECCGRKIPVSLGEPGVLAMVINRLTSPRSKLGLPDWMPTVYLSQWQSFELPEDSKEAAEWFYRTMDWLGRGKEKIEERIAAWFKTLFPVEVVFYDITNIQFEGWDELKQARHGYVRLGRKNHKQILLGLVMVEGFPVASHLFRGNRAEKTTLWWVRKRLKKQFNVGRVIFVCDRGMVSEKNLNEIEAQQDGYIVALRRRKNEEVSPLLEQDAASFAPIVTDEKGCVLFSAWEAPLEEGKRRMVVYNPLKAQQEKKKRAEIMQELREDLEALRRNSAKSKSKKPQSVIAAAEKILSCKHGKRYFSYTVDEKGSLEFSANEKSLAQEERLDGKFVVKTTEKNLSLKEAVVKYKDLMDVEDGFRNLKDFIRVAPVFHWRYRRVKAHVFLCVLALLLERYLEHKLHKAGIQVSARKALDQLKTVKVVTNQVGHLTLKYVTPPTQGLEKLLAACGIFKLPKILNEQETMPSGLQKVT